MIGLLSKKNLKIFNVELEIMLLKNLLINLKKKIIFSFLILFFFYTSPSMSKNNCDVNNNYIYYSDVQDDEHYRKIGFWKSGKGANKINLTNYSYIVKSPDKDYEVEYVAIPEEEKKDSGWVVYSGNFIAKNLKTCESITNKFTIGDGSSNFAFLESSLYLSIRFPRATWYRYSGMTCKNEQNPQCMKKLSEVNIIGFRDLKNNLTYADFVINYKNKVAEQERIVEEKRIAEEEKKIEEKNKQIKRRKIAADQERKQKEADEKRRAEKEAIANKPENRLYDAYTFYISIKKFYEANALYYVDSSKMREAKSQIIAIENILVEKDSTMNIDNIWNRAANKIDRELDANIMSIAAANPTKQFQAMATVFKLGLEDIYNKIIGPQKTIKDF